jgi:hypothetical protein
MVPVLESRREAIAALSDKYAVRRLDIFGSAGCYSQSSQTNPLTRWNSRVLCVTSTAP